MSMQNSIAPAAQHRGPRRFDWLHVTLLLLLTIVVTAVIGIWLARTYFFPSEFEPVALSEPEHRALDVKIDRLGRMATGAPPARTGSPTDALPNGRLEPEAYSEAHAVREVTFSERELNALIASNPDTARRLALDLSDDLISAKLLLPVDPDFPIFAGKIIRVRAGVELAFARGRPMVRLRGVSIMGVPLPNAWLGGLKNIDLIHEFGAEPGFWHSFAEGIDDLRVEDGTLRIILRE